MKRRSKKIRKADSTKVKPAISIVCGQMHLISTKEEIKGLFCGKVQVTLKRGGSLFKKSHELCCCPEVYLMTVKDQTATRRAEVKVRLQVGEMFRLYYTDVRPFKSLQSPNCCVQNHSFVLAFITPSIINTHSLHSEQ